MADDGKATIVDPDGSQRAVRPGVTVFLADSRQRTWHSRETVCKTRLIAQTM